MSHDQAAAIWWWWSHPEMTYAEERQRFDQVGLTTVASIEAASRSLAESGAERA